MHGTPREERTGGSEGSPRQTGRDDHGPGPSQDHNHHHDHGRGHRHTHDHDHDHSPGGAAGGHGHGGERSFRPSPALLGILVLAILAMLVFRTFFFVDETQYVYVTQFGKPVRLCARPGLQVKWPYQSVWRFDRRLQMYEPPAREMLTQDKENLNVGWYVCWRLPTPEFARSLAGEGGGGPAALERCVRRFLESMGTMEAAQNRLEERIQAAIAAEIGRTQLSQLVSLDPEQLALDEIMERVTGAIRQAAAEQFGIEVVDVRIKRFNYPEAVKPAVFAEIRSERERVAVQHRAEGASQKTRIESLATLQRDQLLAQAEREATRIRGEGEAKAMEILNAAHSKNPEFYELLKTLETYQAVLDEQTTVVLSADSPLLKLLIRGLPSLSGQSSRGPSPVAGERPEATPAASGDAPGPGVSLRDGEPNP